jgi:hypothetical protein
MPTILDLFDSSKKELYNDELIRIESRGLINPPRGAALLASSPNSLGDLIGGQLAGAIGGVANRPSDTIFKGTAFFRKPVTLTAFTEAGLRDAVDAGEKYYVKPNPSPPSVLAQLSQGGTSAKGLATNLAIGALNKYGSPKKLKGLFKNAINNLTDEDYGTKNQSLKPGSDPLLSDKKFSKYKEIYQYGGFPIIYNNSVNEIGKVLGTDNHVKSLKQRPGIFKWDQGQKYVNETLSIEETQIPETITKYRDTNQIWVLFQKYGKSTVVPFAGAVSGISEDVTPEWTNFRYVGNPFKTYRYQGVERSLKFNLKLYYTTTEEKQAMISKINYLKSLAFPDDTISEITYGSSTSQTSQYAFSPNLVYLTIGDLYKKSFGYIESLSFSIDDNVTWPNADSNGGSEGTGIYSLFGLKKDNTLYPSVIDVSIGMKLIENHTTEKVGTVTKYKYDFDGNTYNADLYKNKIGMKEKPFVIEEK